MYVQHSRYVGIFSQQQSFVEVVQHKIYEKLSFFPEIVSEI